MEVDEEALEKAQMDICLDLRVELTDSYTSYALVEAYLRHASTNNTEKPE